MTPWCHHLPHPSDTRVSGNTWGVVGALLGVRTGHHALRHWHKDRLVPRAVSCPEGEAGPWGVLQGLPKPQFQFAGSSGLGGSERGSVGVQASPDVKVGGSPSGGLASQCHLPLLWVMPGAAPGRGLGDLQLPARGWGKRIDLGRSAPGMPPQPPSQQCPPGPGCSPSPAVLAPTLPGRCGAAIFPAHPIPLC